QDNFVVFLTVTVAETFLNRVERAPVLLACRIAVTPRHLCAQKVWKTLAVVQRVLSDLRENLLLVDRIGRRNCRDSYLGSSRRRRRKRRGGGAQIAKGGHGPRADAHALQFFDS